MEKEVVTAVIWAFIKDERPKGAIDIAVRKLDSQDLDDVLTAIVKHYLKRLDAFNFNFLSWIGLIPCFRPSLDSVQLIIKYLQAAYDAVDKIQSPDKRRIIRRRIVEKNMKIFGKSNIFSGELIEEMHVALSLAVCRLPSEKADIFVRRIIRRHSKVAGIPGTEIFKMTKCMSTENALTEVERLVPIFIARGDCRALKEIGKKYGRLENEIASRSEEIITACLKHGSIDGAIEALSWVTDTGKRFEYADMLGAMLANGDSKN